MSKKHFKRYFCALIISFQLLCASIQEITSLQKVWPHLYTSSELLVVVDIDNTFLKSDINTVLSWFTIQTHLFLEEVLPHLHTLNLFLEKIGIAKFTLPPSRITEQEIYDIFTYLTSMNIHFLIVTARNYVELTMQQLASLKLPALSYQGQGWSNICYTLNNIFPYIRYDNGVLFSGILHSKGCALGKFLKKVNYLPTTLVAVDDKRSNLESFEKMAQKMGIKKFIGLHYTHVI